MESLAGWEAEKEKEKKKEEEEEKAEKEKERVEEEERAVEEKKEKEELKLAWWTSRLGELANCEPGEFNQSIGSANSCVKVDHSYANQKPIWH